MAWNELLTKKREKKSKGGGIALIANLKRYWIQKDNKEKFNSYSTDVAIDIFKITISLKDALNKR